MFSIALDIGNSRVHLGAYIDNQWTVEHVDHKSFLEGHSRLLESLEAWSEQENISSLKLGYISLSKPRMTQQILSFITKKLDSLSITLYPIESAVSLYLNYEGKMGIDRKLRLIYGKELSETHQKPIALFTLGTAFTAEIISSEGELIDSVILPGIQMNYNALHTFTAALPQISWKELPPSNLGTRYSLTKGIHYSIYGTIHYMMSLYPDSHLIITGGNRDFVDIGEKIEAIELIMIMKLMKSQDPLYVPLGAQVTKKHDSLRLDKYLSTIHTFLNRSQWNLKISKQDIRIFHQNEWQNRDYVKEGDQIFFHKRTLKKPRVEPIWDGQKLDILFDNNDIIAFSKPPYCVIHPKGNYFENTFVQVLENKGFENVYPVHRLDRDTSGVLLCARKSRPELSLALRRHQIGKMYYALCLLPEDTSSLEDPFFIKSYFYPAKNSVIRVKMETSFEVPPQDDLETTPAETRFILLSKSQGVGLFACFPISGKTNQIRIHLSYINAYLIGDKMYHPDENVFLQYDIEGLSPNIMSQVLHPRHLLHCAVMDIARLNLKILPFVAPIPDDFQEFCLDYHKEALPFEEFFSLKKILEIYTSSQNILFKEFKK